MGERCLFFAPIYVLIPCCREGLYAALSDPIHGLYTTNASAPLQQQAGLRNYYDWGLYGYCAYVNTTAGTCSNMTAANRFQPYNVITSDMLGNYSSFTDYIITSGTFIDSPYLGNFTNGAYYLLLIGTVCAALALIWWASFTRAPTNRRAY